MKKFFAALSVSFLIASYLSAELPGRYSCWGNDPFGSPYSAEATITKTGNIFNVYWYYEDGSSETGTGVKKNNHIAFVYQDDQDAEEIGVAIFKIQGNQLTGNWIYQGGTGMGTETMDRIGPLTP